ncbi:MAG TPA: hypothetical protein VNZ44_07705 [Pyrinomonadaceae bacterium]|nr:hypothetical protein [Pyrinomonadaceae bacterium]
MGKYSDIVNGSWVDMTLYAESIPHLLHWDLAYFWVLEKDHLKPESWEERIEAWRYLVGLFIVGELEVEEELIQTPFLAHTQPYGITKVGWLRLKGTQQRVGVLSPAVLVRPLPDFRNTDLKQWKKSAVDPAETRPGELAFFAKLVVESLRKDGRADSFRGRLADILEREFEPAAMAAADRPASEARTVQLLARLFWAQEPDGVCVEDLSILVKRGSGGAQPAQVRSYIPRCSRCGHALTRVEDAPPIIVAEEQFQVDCQQCGAANSLDLAPFLIWLRSRNRVVVWRHEHELTALSQGAPPPPEVKNNIDVQFQWDAAQMDGERHRRFLRLRFPDKTVTQHRLDEIFYTQVLVPGDPEKFTGLPVRAEWTDAIADPAAHTVEADVSRPTLNYRGLLIRGWPEPLRRSFVTLKTEPALSIGVYPNPQKMHEGWRLYRTFLAGGARRDYHLVVAGTAELLPWLREGTEGAPEFASVTDKKSDSVGVTYWQGRAATPAAARPHRKVYVGIDLGTTNTLAYSMSFEQKERKETVSAADHGVRPSAIHAGVGWVVESADARQSQTVGDFLPGPTYGERQPDGRRQTDPYIIPSALWEVGPQHLIRWTAEPPADGAEPKSDFKLGGGRELRGAFARELFWVVLPYVLLTHAQNSPAHLHVGFAFPLAFDLSEREERMDLMRELGRQIGNESFHFDFYWTDESNACVRFFGSPNPNDLFLVADMGGGTTDVALVKGSYVMQLSGAGDGERGGGGGGASGAGAAEPLQIGSIEFAGGDFVRALVDKKHESQAERRRFHWELRDLIARGECSTHYGSDAAAQTVLNRLTAVVFEFLHTMIQALQARGEQAGEIRLVLVGNGWHLVEAFSSETARRGGRHVFNEYYKNLVGYINPTGGRLKFFNTEDHRLESLPSTKHLVVIGALENVVEEEGRRGASGPKGIAGSKLPAGRGMQIRLHESGQIKVVSWQELVGEDVPWNGFIAQELKDGEFTFNFNTGPAHGNVWLNYLLGLIGKSDRTDFQYPTDMDLRRAVTHNIQGNPPKLNKGPLQLIIEGSWKKRLRN